MEKTVSIYKGSQLIDPIYGGYLQFPNQNIRNRGQDRTNI